MGFHTVDEPLGSVEQFKDALAVQAVFTMHGKERLGIVTEQRTAFGRAFLMDETAVVFREETAGPIVAAGAEGSGYLHDLIRKRHYAFIGGVAHQFPGTEGAQVLELEHAFQKERGVFLMQGRTALAAAGAALAAGMFYTH
jgi:hypothetical protein